jgi:hypothetical protein
VRRPDSARGARPHVVVVGAVRAELSRRTQAHSVSWPRSSPCISAVRAATAVGGEFPTLTGEPVEEADRFAARNEAAPRTPEARVRVHALAHRRRLATRTPSAALTANPEGCHLAVGLPVHARKKRPPRPRPSPRRSAAALQIDHRRARRCRLGGLASATRAIRPDSPRTAARAVSRRSGGARERRHPGERRRVASQSPSGVPRSFAYSPQSGTSRCFDALHGVDAASATVSGVVRSFRSASARAPTTREPRVRRMGGVRRVTDAIDDLAAAEHATTELPQCVAAASPRTSDSLVAR